MTDTLKKLDNGKKKYSVLFSVLSVAVLLPVILLIPSDIIRILLCILLGYQMLTALVYRITGLATGVLLWSYGLLFGMILMLVVLLNSIQLPSFFDTGFITTAGVVLFVLFTKVVPVPRILKETVKKSLDSSRAEEARMIGHEETEPEPKEIRGMSYSSFIQIRGAMRYKNKSYSYDSASPIAKQVRLCFFAFFMVIGFLGIMAGARLENTTETLKSPSFWVTVGSATLLCTGGFIAIVGFLRSLLVPVTIGIIGVAGYYIYQILNRLAAVSMLQMVIVAALLVSILVLTLFLIIKPLTKKGRRTLTCIEGENGNLSAVDLGLMEACPIFDYIYLASIAIFFDEKARIRDFDTFDDNLLFFCANNKMIAAGAMLCLSDQNYGVYVYYKTPAQLNKLKKFLKRNLSYSYDVTISTDEKWDFYKDVLYPEKADLIKLQNANIVEALEKQKFDFSQDVQVLFALFFSERQNALCFKHDMAEHDFDLVIYRDCTNNEEEEAEQSFLHQVIIQKTMRISKGWLNIETLRLQEMARNHCGEYEWFQFGELNEEDDEECSITNTLQE